jgi:hypothetical protein
MDEQTLLHRQINPSFVVNDFVSNQAFSENTVTISSGSFIPTDKDDDKLSIYNGEKFSPNNSYEHFTKQYESYGVLSISVQEAESVDPLKVYEDNHPFDGHCYIDFSLVESNNQKKKRAGKLRDFAVKRGWTFKP